MKYVITDHNKIAIGSGTNHRNLGEAISGIVVKAGEFTIKNNRVEVFGESYGYSIKALPEDALEIERYLGLSK